MHFPRTPARLAGGALTLALALTATACSETDAPRAAPADGSGVTVTNCGVEVSFDAPPERVVTIKSTTTELMLALGLEDRIVGHGFPDGPVPPAYEAQAVGLETLSTEAPSQEVVLEKEPDLVFAGWESNLAADTAGERDTLAKLGVQSYVAPSACQSAGAPEKMTYDLLFEHFAEAGEIFGVPEAAEELVTRQRAELAGLADREPIPDGTTALWWSSGVDTPFVGGGTGAPQMVMEEIGLTNVAAHIDQTWTSLGWEAIVDADPDVIVLVDAAWNTAEQKMQDLRANPATAELDAVKEERFLVIPFPAAEAGVRSVPAAVELLTQYATLEDPVR
ncbi:putative F420-0 ABC transporter substrate-binding protein [Nocardioides gilvus]|uniref:putative F420-0 ABC transporter substrate-binding protein n=1 Tax=Nocardioides gilvus TaxID=1735589 RepID=UPI000D74D23B|nr:putative F420-0 ABC transporter substrate-binding protein [Nocardioides gilvus]